LYSFFIDFFRNLVDQPLKTKKTFSKRKKVLLSMMLTTAFSFFQFCDCKNSVFVIHSQFLFSNFDEERVANTKNEKCN